MFHAKYFGILAPWTRLSDINDFSRAYDLLCNAAAMLPGYGGAPVPLMLGGVLGKGASGLRYLETRQRQPVCNRRWYRDEA